MTTPGGRGGRAICFGDFRLDRVEGHLRRGEVEVSLRAKSFALLRYLAENPGRLVTRAELLRAVWPGAAVSPSVVRVGIRELREALGDDPEVPRFIETVGRRGYRFTSNGAEARGAEPSFVGRAAELAQLHGLLERCRALRRQVVFVSGEPGIGKTALVERFVEEVRGADLGRVAQGQCVNLRGSSEPYLPILEMLGRVCRDDPEGEVVAVLNRWAPSWLLQMPGVVDAPAAEVLRRRVPNPTRDRMLRELADALDVLAKDTPLVLVLEDLHWGDASTVDLLVYIAERSMPSRLLIIGTYRPVDAVLSGHPMRTAARDLVARGRGVEMALELLTPRDVEAFLVPLLAGAPIEPHLAGTMHRRTDGNPLFLTSMIEYLLDRGILAVRDGSWGLNAEQEGVPPSLRELVAREIEALADDDQAMLAAASVVGFEFDALSVVAATAQGQRRVEDGCARLAGRGQLVRSVGMTSWPDGTTGGTYKFLHALHREAVYERIAPAECARLHRAVGERIEIGWAREPGTVAAILASHFEHGADWPKAIRHHAAAAEASKARLADREVVAHCEAALSLLPRLPRSPERDQTEMACSLDLGGSLLALRGYAAPEVKPLFVRARDLALALELPQVEIIARGGLYTSEVMGGDQRRALQLAGDLLAMADRFPIPLFVMIGHTTLGASSYNLGNFADARDHLERARAAWEPGFPRLPLDQRALFLGLGSFVLLMLGDTAEADAWNAALIEYARELDDPINAAHACDLIGAYRMYRGDRHDAVAWADRAIDLAVEHGFPAHAALARLNKGYAQGDLSVQRENFAVLQGIGYRVDVPVHRLQMAETLLGEERWDEAREELALALAAAAETGEARHLAEIHRCRAASLRAAGRLDETTAALHEAISIARRQQCRFFEQRARADLAACKPIIR